MNLNDLSILQHLFFDCDENVIVFDPNQVIQEPLVSMFVFSDLPTLQQQMAEHKDQGFCVFNFSQSELSMEAENLLGIINFNFEKGIPFHYINNPDKSMRWIFPASNASPAHLALYNNTGWKAECYKKMTRLVFRLGISKYLANGTFWVQGVETRVHRFFDKKPIDDYAIFTGTVGKDRKAVMALFQKNSCSHFVKIPLTKKAKQLVLQEQKNLNLLQDLDLQHLNFPKITSPKNHLCQSNVKPDHSSKNTGFNKVHLRALEELYSKTIHSKKITELSVWESINNRIQFLKSNPNIKNDISPSTVQVITYHLQKIIAWLQAEKSFAVALAHGDFTPWNMYETADNIHVYDWEMAKSDMPLLFDAFHYIFQSSILIEQGSFETILAKLQSLKEHSITQKMLQKYKLDWSKCYAFYVVYITTYYLPLYVQQSDLHMQAHWLIDTWKAALSDISSKIPSQNGKNPSNQEQLTNINNL